MGPDKPDIPTAYWIVECDQYRESCPAHVMVIDETRSHAIDQWNRRLGGDASHHREKPLISTIRWTRAEEKLPPCGLQVAIWVAPAGIVIRGVMDGHKRNGWCMAGGRPIAAAHVMAWTELPAGPLPAPDGGAS
jgi:hypothetical protein